MNQLFSPEITKVALIDSNLKSPVN